jgi:hypothetical protein
VGMVYRIDSSMGVSNCGQITKVAEHEVPCQTSRWFIGDLCYFLAVWRHGGYRG